MRRLAFVVQRYGREVLGGAEEHCRQVVERLAGRFAVEVFTTCARDYLTWRNAYPAGAELIGGVSVQRFPVARPRRVRSFGRFSQAIYDRPHSFRDEAEWMERQGPDAPGLLAALASRRDEFDLFFFFTYLYPPTYFGLPLVADKAVLLPTAHEEPPLRLGIFRALFNLPRGFIFNTVEERALIHRIFHNRHIPSIIGGMGVDLKPPPADPPPAREEYLLYLGRIDVAKGCGQLVEDYRRYAAGQPAPPRLLLAGEVKMKLPRDARIEALGHVSDARKDELLAGALALVNPSRQESLSLVALEAWARGTPVLADGGGAVLRGHLERGGGGWLYRDTTQFARAIAELRTNRDERRRRGLAGRDYVAANYTWEKTVAVYSAFLERICRLVEEARADRD